MADDNAMNLHNQVIPRPSQNDQTSSIENANEHQVVLPVGGEISEQSARQELSLSQALGQMTGVLQVLDQNSYRIKHYLVRSSTGHYHDFQ